MKSKFFPTAIAVLALSISPVTFAQTQQEPENIGQGAKSSAKDVKSGTEKGVDKLDARTEKGAREFKSEAKEAKEAIKDGNVIEAGKDIGQGTGKLGAETGKGIGGFFKSLALGIGRGAKSLAKGVKNAFDDDDKD